ncbi:MAG: DNA helicase PcrA [Firmicutes bacterium]|nr:DNA helicase PcrA [Bacillota bacterium]
MDYLNELNPVQRRAVEHVEGPLLIIAGAGSGKTRVLTYRIAHLLKFHQVQPYKILAVTFTNKAAREMKERVSKVVGFRGEQVWVNTFHSTCVQILRQYADRLGYKRNFQIFDSVDQQAVIKDCLKDLNMDPKKFDPRAILGSISKAKNELITYEQYNEEAIDFWEQMVAKVYEKYQKKLFQNNAFDFDDLIMATVTLFQQNPDVLERFQDRFQFIMVDEYQDTNHAQYVLINLLAQKYRNLCVVGDEDQSIYSFRGADIRNILDFEKDYPEATVIKLEQNYRSTKKIIAAANSVIKNNLERKAKLLFTENEEGESIGFFRANDEKHEAAFVANVISNGVREKGYDYEDFTILYRTHAQSRVLEEEFIRRGIPYKIVSGLRFYERKEIKDLLAYLRLIYNSADDYSLSRIINVPKRGIGLTTLTKLESYAQEKEISLFEAILEAQKVPTFTKRNVTLLEEFKDLILQLRKTGETVNLTEFAEAILRKTGYLEELEKENSLESEGRIENLREFLSLTQQFSGSEGEAGIGVLGEFLEHVALISDVDNYDEDANVVNLMTLHSAKGLEFPVVFLVGLEDGIFPHSRSLFEPGQLEEERRLAYVGITRARRNLFLTCARFRTIFGKSSANEVSTFVSEIPEDLIEDLSPNAQIRPLNDPKQTSFAVDLANASKTIGRTDNGVGNSVAVEYKVGDKIRHKVWGEGMVVSVTGQGADALVSLAFPNQDIRKVIAGLAPMEKLNP